MIRKPSFATVGLVYAKELRETLRDRRTIMVMVLFPMVVYPLMSLVLAQVMASKATKNASYASRVAITNAGGGGGASLPAGAGLRQAIERARADFALQATGTASDVELGRLDALIVVETPAHAAAAPAVTPVSVIYDETREPSNQARDRIDRLWSACCRPSATWCTPSTTAASPPPPRSADTCFQRCCRWWL